MYQIIVNTPPPEFVAFESEDGHSILENWKAMVQEEREPGNTARLIWKENGKEVLLGNRQW
jgi:hypothetical protein